MADIECKHEWVRVSDGVESCNQCGRIRANGCFVGYTETAPIYRLFDLDLVEDVRFSDGLGNTITMPAGTRLAVKERVR